MSVRWLPLCPSKFSLATIKGRSKVTGMKYHIEVADQLPADVHMYSVSQ